MNKLLHDDVWYDGHISDVAVVAIADGQDGIVPEDAREHADRCAACLARVAEASLLSLEITNVLARTPGEERASVRAAGIEPRAIIAIAAGVALTILGALPSLPHLSERLENAGRFAFKAFGIVSRVVAHEVVEGGTPMGLALTLGALLVFVVAGFVTGKAVSHASVERSVV